MRALGECKGRDEFAGVGAGGNCSRVAGPESVVMRLPDGGGKECGQQVHSFSRWLLDGARKRRCRFVQR